MMVWCVWVIDTINVATLEWGIAHTSFWTGALGEIGIRL